MKSKRQSLLPNNCNRQKGRGPCPFALRFRRNLSLFGKPHPLQLPPPEAAQLKKREQLLKRMREGSRRRKTVLAVSLLFTLLFVLAGCVTQAEIDAARAAGTPAPTATPLLDPETGEFIEDITQDEEDDEDEGIVDQLVGLLGSRSQSLQIVALLTILSLAPSILIMLTSFVRIIMVLSFTRSAMGLQQTPPNQVLVGLALFLTFFVMSPVLDEIKTEAFIPYAAEQITLDEAVEVGIKPIRSFMLRQTVKNDIYTFYGFAGLEPPDFDNGTLTDEEIHEIPMRILIPAFLTSELKRAFQIGFFIYLPFIVIDMIVASTLMAMGMMMLPPIIISLPFKVLLFVLADGWMLTVGTLITGFK